MTGKEIWLDIIVPLATVVIPIIAIIFSVKIPKQIAQQEEERQNKKEKNI